MSNEMQNRLGELLRAPGELMGAAEGGAGNWRLAAFLSLVTAAGCALFGFAFAQAISVNVFSSSIQFRPLLLPITILVSILVTGLACIAPVSSATKVDPAIVLKGE